MNYIGFMSLKDLVGRSNVTVKIDYDGQWFNDMENEEFTEWDFTYYDLNYDTVGIYFEKCSNVYIVELVELP